MKNILLLYEALNPSVRLCAYEQLMYLSSIGKIKFDYCEFKKVSEEICLRCDIVILVRSDSVIAKELAKELNKLSKFLIYVLDDDILNIPIGLVSSDYYRSRRVKKRIKSIMSYCSLFLTTSPNLLEAYGPLFKRSELIEEPCLNVDTIDYTDSNDSIVKIGFAGSIDREGDIEIVLSNVIRELLKKYKEKLVIEFIGARPNIVDECSLNHYPYLDNYKEYQKLINNQKWDIGLAPMLDTPFHNCKHYNKFIEYSSSSIIGVYSNVQPYTRVVVQKKNGVLCENNTESWVTGISWLIDNVTNRKEISGHISQIVRKQFAIEIVSEQYLDAIGEVDYPVDKTRKINIKIIKVKSIILRAYEFVLRNGVRTPMCLMRKIKNL